MSSTNIDGVRIKTLERNVDERGELVELFRSDWDDFFDEKPAMNYFSVTYPGVVRAWHRHTRGQIDHIAVLQGNMKIAVYDDRENSDTRGELDEFFIGERNMAIVRIPGDCWHGVKCIGDEPAVLVNFPSNLYDYENPDEERKDPFDNDIPYDWDLEMK